MFMQCFARLVRAILGPTAVSAKKLDYGRELVILGVRVSPTFDHCVLQLDDAKRDAYLQEVERRLAEGTLTAGAAAKLAGRLSFASQWCFKRLGRAMLRPMFAQQHSPP